MATPIREFSTILASTLILAACQGGGGGGSNHDDNSGAGSGGGSGNSTPIANAGADFSVAENTMVVLNGQNSYDPDGDTFSYQWRQTAGPTITLSSDSSASPSFVAPAAGTNLSYELVTNDGISFSAADSVSITVVTSTGNLPPIADAGPNQVVPANVLVALDGEASYDPDGSPISYQWLQTSGPSINLNSLNIAKPNFSAPANDSVLTFSLTVNDGQDDSETDTVIIGVGNVSVNLRPVANAGPDQNVDGNTLVFLDGNNSTDPDSDSLSYLWRQTGGPVVVLDSTSIVNPTFASPTSGGNLFFSLTVNDGQQNSLSDTVNITVTEVVSSTRPIANAGNDQTVNGNTLVTLNGSNSSDPNNDILSYAWLQNGGTMVTLSSLTETNPSFTAPSNAEVLSFALTVSDGQESSLVDTVSISILQVNTPPLANAGVDRFVSSNAVVTLFGLNSFDADDDTLSYLWQQVSGPSAVLNSTTSATPSFSADVDGRLIFSLVVNDGEASSVADLMTVTVGEIPVTNTKVNGTGIIWGANYPSGNNTSCIGETIDQQDCYGGRDVSHNDDSDGRAGFSYAKISSNGTVLTANATDWDCVEDLVTGLTWEVKKGGNTIVGDEGLHDADDVFRWYNSDPSSNGGGNGFDSIGTDSCFAYTDGDPNSFCNTQAFTARVNTAGLCGYNDWRMPSRKEMTSLIDFGEAPPMMESNYFPAGGVFEWTGTPLALGNTSAWGVLFSYGNSFNVGRGNSRRARLVRSDP